MQLRYCDAPLYNNVAEDGIDPDSDHTQRGHCVVQWLLAHKEGISKTRPPTCRTAALNGAVARQGSRTKVHCTCTVSPTCIETVPDLLACKVKRDVVTRFSSLHTVVYFSNKREEIAQIAFS